MGTKTLQTPSQAGVLVVRGCSISVVAGGYAPVWGAPVAELPGAVVPFAGTALPPALRLRVLGTDVPMTGRPIGAGHTAETTTATNPTVTSTTPKSSTTPGDLSLGGPPS